MNEKRFKKGDWTNCRYDICEIVTDDDEIICVVALKDADKIIGLLEDNWQLRKDKVQLKKRLRECRIRLDKFEKGNTALLDLAEALGVKIVEADDE